jgi:hypothetical protein
MEKQIVAPTIPIAKRARAIRLDVIRAGEALVASDLSVEVARVGAIHPTVAVICLVAHLGEWDHLDVLDFGPIEGEKWGPEIRPHTPDPVPFYACGVL